jgi:hypothetical protein
MRRNGYIKRTPFERKPPAEKPQRNYEGQYSTLKRSRKKALGTKKPEPGSRKDLEDRLASSLAKRVKMEAGYQCEQCRYDGAPTVPPLDAGHIYPKGKFPGGKFLYANLASQCRAHNLRHIDRPEFMFVWYQRVHGPEALESLHALVLAQPRRQSIEWLKRVIEESEGAIAEMELLAVA